MKLLAKRTDKLCEAVGTTLASERERNARLMAEIDAQGPLSAEEEEQFQTKQAAYDLSRRQGAKGRRYSDVEWGRLDHRLPLRPRYGAFCGAEPLIIGRIEGATRVLGKSQGYLGLPLRDV